MWNTGEECFLNFLSYDTIGKSGQVCADVQSWLEIDVSGSERESTQFVPGKTWVQVSEGKDYGDKEWENE